MATYKKRGGKKSIRSEKNVDIIQESKTAEVFETLDNTASKTEEWVVKYQNVILVSIGLVAIHSIGVSWLSKFHYTSKISRGNK